MSSQNLTAKEIQAYKVRSIVFLVLMIAGILSAFYFYLQVQAHQQELEGKNEKLEIQKDSLIAYNKAIIEKDSTIVDLQKFKEKERQLKDAINLVQILVNQDTEDADTMSTSEILAGLHEMAETKKKEQQAYANERKFFIKDLFNRNENKRVGARRKLSKLHADDPKLVKEILAAVSSKILTTESSRNLINQYQNNISQILYLFTTLSTQSLDSQKDQLETFFTALLESNIFNPTGKSVQQIEDIRAKLEAV